MNKNLNLIISLLINLIFITQAYAQKESNPEITKTDSLTNFYRKFSAGANRSIYRDFATSPLFYSGNGLHLQSSWLKRSSRRERSFEIGFNINSLSARIPKSNFIQSYTGSIFGQFNLRYLQLWNINSLSNSQNDIKVGGIIQSSQNIRFNQDLQNNSLGAENISNLMVSAEITRDVSRKDTFKINLWLFKIPLKPVKKDLRFRVNTGILNFNYRPSYAYAYDNEIIGLETSPVNWFLSNYQWSINGWRLNTEIEYIIYLPNGNARSWSYVWDVANVPGRHEKFQMASHQIRYTYYFKTKEK